MDRRPCGRRPLGGGVAGPRRRRGARRALDTPGRGIAALQFGDRALGRDRGARSGRREEPQVQQDRVTPPPQDWWSSIRPYFERAPLAAFLLGVSSGFPYAMIGATLTTRLAQDGIDKKTVTAFTLAFLVYNLKPLWSWVVDGVRSEEHTSELQSLMRISYAVFCLK